MAQWWKTLYEKRFKDRSEWSVPGDDYVRSQVRYVLMATGLKPPAELLDLGAGTGRHVACLARNGYRATGLEYSKVLVEKGRELSPGINLSTGDMRELEGASRYDAITFFDTSFGIFEDGENEDMLVRVFNALKPGSWLAIDYLNPDFWKKKSDDIDMQDYRFKGDKFVRRYRYNEGTFRLTESGVYTSPAGHSEAYPDQVLALYPPGRLEVMLQRAGFINAAFYGSVEYDYPDALKPISSESAFILCVVRKFMS